MVWSNQAPTSLVFPPGATTGARIVLENDGIYGYDANNHLVFAFTNLEQPSLDLTDNPVVISTYPYNPLEPTAQMTFGSQALMTYFNNALVTLALNEAYIAAGNSLTAPSNVSALYLNYLLGSATLAAQQYVEITASSTGTALFVVPSGISTLGYPPAITYSAYYEDVQLSAQSIATSTYTNTTNLTVVKSISNYSSAWNTATGVWTCPASGLYHWTVNIAYNSWTTNARAGIYVPTPSGGAAASSFLRFDGDVPSLTTAPITLSGVNYFNTADTANVIVFQATGSTQSIASGQSHIRIARLLS